MHIRLHVFVVPTDIPQVFETLKSSTFDDFEIQDIVSGVFGELVASGFLTQRFTGMASSTASNQGHKTASMDVSKHPVCLPGSTLPAPKASCTFKFAINCCKCYYLSVQW